MTQPFVHLRIHSEFSLADGIVRIPDLVAAAAADGMPAIALTDLANLFGAAKFHQAAIGAGVKPINGADLWLANSGDPNKPFRFTALCQNTAGYRNLCRLLTRAFIEGQHTGRPCVQRDWLEQAADGLIILSGAHEGDVGAALLAGQVEQARALIARYQACFGDRYYLELQRTGQPRQEDYNHAAVAAATANGVPVVATNPVVFLKADEFEAHEVRVCIQEGRVLTDARRPRRYTTQQYLRSAAEMAELFADIPEALANTRELARRCNFRMEFGRYYLPKFETPGAAAADVNEVLTQNSHAGLERRLALYAPAEREAQRPAYAARLALEIDVIIKMGFAGYFLIVADFIQWAKQNGIPVGPGRGSGAGSLVAYCLGITELDPIKYELLFERFLNPERVSLPDFDIDFCMERRDEVIEYVTQRYGADKVAQIITHGTMAAKAVVRDVGRVMDHPYGYCDKLAKLIPFEVGMTLERALEIEPLLKERYEKEEDVRALLDTAKSLEGLARNAGKHAGGVVIAPSALTDFMPLYCEQGGQQAVTQFDMEDLEKLGLVKFDFLGLRTLTIIDKAVKIINRKRVEAGDVQGSTSVAGDRMSRATEAPLVIEQLPIDDPKTYALLKSGRTTALFQLESRGMKDLINRLKPDAFEEIVALVALFRPGPLESGMVDDFIKRKRGAAKIDYLHPSLEAILKPTYGVIVYQEQVMQIARVLSGYTLGGADLLRRAMGKKKPEEMAKQRQAFVNGAKERNVSEKQATYIFDLIEKFAGYGFNRSHSAAYALIAYQTAWLKAHYPAAFMAAVLSADMDHTDKVVTMIAECRDMKLELLPPDVNRCEYEFVPIDDRTILYGLGAIKGLGQSAIDAILQTRANSGPFADLFDLCKRIDARKVNKRTLESLIKAGALDSLGTHRAALMASLPKAMAAADQHSKNHAMGQVDIFGTVVPADQPTYETVAEWSEALRLDGERDTLGLYLTGHPIARYAEELKQFVSATIAELKPTENRTVTVAGLVVAMRVMQTKRGDRMAFITLDDRTGRLELAIFSEMFERHRELLVKDNLLVVEGQVSVDEYTGGFKMSADKVYNIDQARAAFGRRLVIKVDAETAGNGFMEELQQILAPASQGPCSVWLHYHTDVAEADIVLGEEWRIHPSESVLERLTRLAGERNVHLEYR